MCLIYFAKKINIYFRETDKITKADIISTYLFIASMIVIMIFYTKQYYTIVVNDINTCNKHDTRSSCLKSEFTYIVIPYIGIIYSFFQAFYKITDILAFISNCICCCKPLVNNNNDDDIDIGETTIEINSFVL